MNALRWTWRLAGWGLLLLRAALVLPTVAWLPLNLRDAALLQPRRADRLQRQLWEGARMLVGHMVVTRLARNTYGTMATAAQRDPALAEAMTPWLAEPLDTRAGARRWMVCEADFWRGALYDPRRDAITFTWP